MQTYRPGKFRNHDSPVAECCVPKRPVPPPIDRIVSGTSHWPPDIYRNFEISLTSASAPVGRKSLNMISTTGRRPVTAMPRATPSDPFSQIGVLITRPGKASAMPSLVLKTPPAVPTSSPMKWIVRSDASSSIRAALTASR